MIKPISERNAHASLNVPWTCLIQIHVSAMEGEREIEKERERKESHFTAQIEIVRITRTLSAFQQLCLSLSLFFSLGKNFF